jgi:predicted membrane protein
MTLLFLLLHGLTYFYTHKEGAEISSICKTLFVHFFMVFLIETRAKSTVTSALLTVTP